ncbi:MFS transporter [Paenarthrobacter ureafaciens]|uniref:MFS transporter n=1 Tax=Paenarthrobacter TaxID=1742992 RepID=UPI00074D30C4|nr:MULTISPECIES: MFS transporter [Paenarthrobacter]AMB39605.1 MFS transporter [Arthrobacter sp. ATCC 21022]KUR65288.1 major facilitator transporter [Arthrobacter sp. ATCC 21022]MBN9131030.1 MFS transporter [Paenarthrobacter ureafaciens]MCW3766785.1 MFS transporter [Paenarthrobacter sp. PAE-2]MEC3852639.1 MFS transporter [Paenarthrobacter ureafaciens]
MLDIQTDNAVPAPKPITDSRSKNAGFTPEVRKGLLGLGLGNALEWYDWMVFGLLSAFIGPNFFPGTEPLSATLNALAVFAVGFAFRPLGGILLGTLADRIGRRRVMLLSIMLMAGTTLVIAVTPSYATIGAWAGIILVVCRILQGISTGIEAPLSTSHAVELAPEGREGYVAGIMSFYVNIGILMASLVSFLCSLVLGAAAMGEWGWRVPFIIGALFGFVVLYLRRSLPETLKEEEMATNTPRAVWKGVSKHWLSVLAIIFVVGAAQAYNYAWNVGLPSAARSGFKEDPTAVFALTTILGVILVVGSWVVGKLADGKAMSKWFLVTRVLAIPAVFLMLLYVQPGIGGFAAVLLGGSIVLVLNMTLYNVVSSSLMPKNIRGTGVALGYGIGVAIFGGTASYLLVWFQSLNLTWIFPVYVAVLSILSIVFYIAARRTNGIHVGK